MWLVFLLYALFATVFTASKEALKHAEPFFLVGSRMLVAGVLMLAVCYFRRIPVFNIKRSAWGKIFLLALFNIYLTNVFEFWGLQYLTSFKTCFIYSLAPFVSALLSYLIFEERLSSRKWLGLVIGFSGFMPILISQTSSEQSAGGFWMFSWAELAVVAAAVSSVYGWILLKQVIQQENVAPLSANALSMTIGGVFALTHSAVTEGWNPVPINHAVPFFECTIFLIIISNCICYNLYGYLLKRFSATFISFAGLTTALFTALLGWIIHGEMTSISFWISFLVVCFGLVVFHQEELYPFSTELKPERL